MSVTIVAGFEQDFTNSGSFHVNLLQFLLIASHSQFPDHLTCITRVFFVDPSFRGPNRNRGNFGNSMRVFREITSTCQSR